MLTYKSYRYLAAYSPTMQSLGKTYQIADRLHKSDRICGFLNQVKVQLEDLLCRRSPNYTCSGGGSICAYRREEIPPIPNETLRVAKAAFPKGNLYMRLRDELGVFYQDEDFASLYPQRGQPAQAPWRLAMILVMQYLENLSDRQAASSVQGRIDWKYALSLELTDPGFDFSALSEFRNRLIIGGVERQILDLMLSKFQELKLLSARGKQLLGIKLLRRFSIVSLLN